MQWYAGSPQSGGSNLTGEESGTDVAAEKTVLGFLQMTRGCGHDPIDEEVAVSDPAEVSDLSVEASVDGGVAGS
jgi:hypothetical protein